MLGKVLAGAVVLLKVKLMARRGAAFTELMRCARALSLSGCVGGRMHNRVRIPATTRTPFKARFVFIIYRPMSAMIDQPGSPLNDLAQPQPLGSQAPANPGSSESLPASQDERDGGCWLE